MLAVVLGARDADETLDATLENLYHSIRMDG